MVDAQQMVPDAAPRSATESAQSAQDADPRRWQFVPLKWTLVWLLGTLVVFFFTEPATRVPSGQWWPTIAVALSGAACFSLGYWLRCKSRTSRFQDQIRRVPPSKTIVFSSMWALLYCFAYLRFYHALNPFDLLAAVTDPGSAYKAKFEVYEIAAGQAPDSLIQLVTLLSGFMTLLTPLTIIWWKELRPTVRVCGVVGSIAFVVPFVAIGTNQGIGYLALFIFVGVLVARYSRDRGWKRKRIPTKARLTLIVVLLLGMVFFVVGSITRTAAFGLPSDQPYNPVVAAVVGPKVAAGLDSAVYYPTHGYLGLAETLTQPFVFTGGYGGTRALNRYLVRYAGAADQSMNTYPDRTEYSRGYPAGLHWHTVYPWLASDLTFPGAIMFLGLVGWATASVWRRAVRSLDPLAIGLLGYAALFIAFIPGNNQVGLNQANLIGFFTLFGIFLVRPLFRHRGLPSRDALPRVAGARERSNAV